jgi:hypothetical protein
MTPHIVSFGVIGIVWDKSARAGGRHWGAAWEQTVVQH